MRYLVWLHFNATQRDSEERLTQKLNRIQTVFEREIRGDTGHGKLLSEDSIPRSKTHLMNWERIGGRGGERKYHA